MNPGVVAVGWYVRFVPLAAMPGMEHCYLHTFGLPHILRSRVVNAKQENKDFFWGGEALIENHNYGGHEVPISPREADPRLARQVQIFRVSDLDAVIAQLRNNGAIVLAPRPCTYGHEAFVVDPMGMLLGLRCRWSSDTSTGITLMRRRAAG